MTLKIKFHTTRTLACLSAGSPLQAQLLIRCRTSSKRKQGHELFANPWRQQHVLKKVPKPEVTTRSCSYLAGHWPEDEGNLQRRWSGSHRLPHGQAIGGIRMLSGSAARRKFPRSTSAKCVTIKGGN